jgi:hypothetical protein
MRAAAFSMLVFLSSAFAGCGHKMLPIPPGVYPPPVVKNITFERQDDRLTLFWSLPAVRSEKEAPAVGFKILRARQTAGEAECRTCRLRFEVAGEVPAAGREPAERLQFQDRLEPGYEYRYKIISVSAEGLESRDSVSVQPSD